MKPIKTFLFLISIFISIAAFRPVDARAVLVDMNLTPRGYGGFGDLGLYLGPWPYVWHQDPRFNFGFDSILFTIDTSTGNAWIGGEITHVISGENWDLEIHLNGFHYQGNAAPYFSSSDPYPEMMDDLWNAAGNGVVTGFYWDSLNLTISTALSSPAFTGPTEWVGWAMDHPGPAELSSWPWYQIFYNAWYRPADPADWIFLQHHLTTIYWLGDSKNNGDKPVPREPVIPEPSTLLLAGLAAAFMPLRRFFRN